MFSVLRTVIHGEVYVVVIVIVVYYDWLVSSASKERVSLGRRTYPGHFVVAHVIILVRINVIRSVDLTIHLS